MEATRVTYELRDGWAVISIDDGKANVLSPPMLRDLNDALDRAVADEAVVVLRGRPGIFCGGFDLAVLSGGGWEAVAMLRAGFELAARLLAFPRPVVVGCTGHAVAMGAFLLLGADLRVGADGPYEITANEVAIGLTVPRAAIEICRMRLAPDHFRRAVLTSERYSPAAAVEAGYLDLVVPAADVDDVVDDAASRLAALDPHAYRGTKERLGGAGLASVRSAIADDFAELRAAAG